MPFTNYLDQSIVQLLFSDTSYTIPTTFYVALSTTTPSQVKGSAPFWNFTEPCAVTQLTSATGTSAITSIAVQALAVAVTSGDSIKLVSGANNQTFTASAGASVGATSISVTSATPGFNYPIGTTVTDITTTGSSSPYARVAVTNNGTNFTAVGSEPTDGYEVQNGTAITFPTAAGSWGTATYFGLCDAAGGGNLLAFGQLTTAQSIASGATPSFAIGAATFTNN